MRDRLMCMHAIKLWSGPGSTPVNVTRQPMLCGGRRMGWVCIIVQLHIARALCNHNRQVLPKIPRARLLFWCLPATAGQATKQIHYYNSAVLAYHQQQPCCWLMLRGLGMRIAHSYFGQHVVLMQSRYIRCGVSTEWTIAIKKCFEAPSKLRK